MTIKTTCPNCGKTTAFKDEAAVKSAKCSKCGSVYSISVNIDHSESKLGLPHPNAKSKRSINDGEIDWESAAELEQDTKSIVLSPSFRSNDQESGSRKKKMAKQKSQIESTGSEKKPWMRSVFVALMWWFTFLAVGVFATFGQGFVYGTKPSEYRESPSDLKLDRNVMGAFLRSGAKEAYDSSLGPSFSTGLYNVQSLCHLDLHHIMLMVSTGLPFALVAFAVSIGWLKVSKTEDD